MPCSIGSNLFGYLRKQGAVSLARWPGGHRTAEKENEGDADEQAAHGLVLVGGQTVVAQHSCVHDIDQRVDAVPKTPEFS